MGLRPARSKQGKQPQGILPFEYDPTGEVDEVTARAGLPLFLETLRALHVDRVLGEQVKVRKRQSGMDEVEHAEALMLLLASGGECLEDLSILGADKGLLHLLEKEKLPSPDAARQYLLAFHDEELIAKARANMAPDELSLIVPESEPLLGLSRVVTHVVKRMQQLRPSEIATLEADATIIESHKQEAQPHYKGGRGYQPVVVYWVEHDLVVADQFRDGNVPAGKQPLEPIQRGFAAVPGEVKRRRFRGDSACYEEKTLKWLHDPENRIERFTISADMTKELRACCEKVSEWKTYEERADEVVSWSEVEFFPGNWVKSAQPLRTIVLKIQKRQGEFFANGSDHKYLGIVSNDFAEDGTTLIRWHYKKAGHIEVVHDVIKNELGGGVLPSGTFGANAAWFRFSLLTYNIMSAMKTLALPPEFGDARPKRLRFSVFTLPARILSHARQIYARLAQLLCDKAKLIAGRSILREIMYRPAPA